MKIFAWIIALLALSTPALIYHFVSPKITGEKITLVEKIGAFGTVGDWFGGSSVPLLTFSSFLLLYKTLQLQKEQFTDTSEQLISQNKTNSLQRFENTFFHMLSLHNEIVNARSETLANGAVLSGRTLFRDHIYNKSGLSNIIDEDQAIFRRIFNGYNNNRISYMKKVKGNNKSGQGDEEFNNLIALLERLQSVYDTYPFQLALITLSYKKFYKHKHEHLGHYFRSLYRIVRFVDEHEVLSSKEKQLYLGIVRSQLSSYEHVLLLYNCLGHSGGYQNFLPLTKKYRLFDELYTSLSTEEKHLELYNYISDLIDEDAWLKNSFENERDSILEFLPLLRNAVLEYER